MSSPTLKASPVSSAKDESAPEASDPGIEIVQCFQIDDRTLCVIRSAERAYIPLSCFLEWSKTTEQKVISTLKDRGCEMSELKTADAAVCQALQNTLHHSTDDFAEAERLLPLEGAIAYLKVLGKVYEAITLGDRFLKEGLLSEDNTISLPC